MSGMSNGRLHVSLREARNEAAFPAELRERADRERRRGHTLEAYWIRIYGASPGDEAGMLVECPSFFYPGEGSIVIFWGDDCEMWADGLPHRVGEVSPRGETVEEVVAMFFAEPWDWLPDEAV